MKCSICGEKIDYLLYDIKKRAKPGYQTIYTCEDCLKAMA